MKPNPCGGQKCKCKCKPPFQPTITKHFQPKPCACKITKELPEIRCEVICENKFGERIPIAGSFLDKKRSRVQKRVAVKDPQRGDGCQNIRPKICQCRSAFPRKPIIMNKPLIKQSSIDMCMCKKVSTNLSNLKANDSRRLSLTDIKCKTPLIESSNFAFAKSYFKQLKAQDQCNAVKPKATVCVPREGIYKNYAEKLKQEIIANKSANMVHSSALINALRREIIAYRTCLQGSSCQKSYQNSCVQSDEIEDRPRPHMVKTACPAICNYKLYPEKIEEFQRVPDPSPVESKISCTPQTQTIWEANTYCGSSSETELNFEMKLQEANLLIKKVQQTLEDLGSNLKPYEKSSCKSPKRGVKIPCAGKVRAGNKKEISGRRRGSTESPRPGTAASCKKDICERKNNLTESPGRKNRTSACLCKNAISEDQEEFTSDGKASVCRKETCKNKQSAEEIPVDGKTSKSVCRKETCKDKQSAEGIPLDGKTSSKRVCRKESCKNKQSAEGIPSNGKTPSCCCQKKSAEVVPLDGKTSSRGVCTKESCKNKQSAEGIPLDGKTSSKGVCRKESCKNKQSAEQMSSVSKTPSCCCQKKSAPEISSDSKTATSKGKIVISEYNKNDIASTSKQSTCTKCNKRIPEQRQNNDIILLVSKISSASKINTYKDSYNKDIPEQKTNDAAEISFTSRTVCCKGSCKTSCTSKTNTCNKELCKKAASAISSTSKQSTYTGASSKDISEPKYDETNLPSISKSDIRKRDKMGDEKVKFHKVMKIDYVETEKHTDDEFVRELKQVSKNDEEEDETADDVNVTFIEKETILFDSIDDQLEMDQPSEPKITITTEENKDGVIVRVVKTDTPEEQLRKNISTLAERSDGKKKCCPVRDEKQAPQVIKNISELEMFLNPLGNVSSSYSLKKKISVHETAADDTYFNLVHEMKSASEMTSPESKYKMFSVQALPQINLPGPYVLQRTLNLFIDQNGKSYNRIAKEANCDYVEARGFGDSGPSSSQLKPKCIDCVKENCVMTQTQSQAQVSPGHSISGMLNRSTDIVNRVAQKFAMTHDVPLDDIDKDALILFQSYQVLREPGRKAAESKSQEQFEHESEAKNQKIVKEIINNISDRIKRKSDASRITSLTQSHLVGETRSPWDIGFYITKSIQCNLDNSLPLLPISTEESEEDDSIPVKDVDSGEEDRKVSSKVDKINTSKNIQTSLRSSSESSGGSMRKSKRSSRTSRDSQASSDQSFYLNPALQDEGVERFYEEMSPSTAHSITSSKLNTAAVSKSKNLDEKKSKEQDSDLTKLTLNETGEIPYVKNTPKILTVFEKRCMPEGGECASAIRNKPDMKTILKPWDKSLREILKPPKRKIPKAISFPLSLDESTSEGELHCKCSVSIGEVHLCQHLNEIRRKQKIGIAHAEETYSKQFNEQMAITRQRTQYNNWVTYYLQKDKNANNLPDDSSWSSSKSSDLDR